MTDKRRGVRPSLASAISRSVSSIAVETSTATTCSGGTDSDADVDVDVIVDGEEFAKGW